MARKPKYASETNTPYPPFGAQSKQPKNQLPASIMGPRLLLLLTVLVLVMFGFVMVYSSSSIAALQEDKSTEFYLLRQLGFAVVGIIGCVILWKFVPYWVWTGPIVWIAWAVALFLLLLTAVTGTEALGAQRWVNIGPVSIQPAEFAKIAFLLMAARILYDFRNGVINFKGVLIQGFLLILLPLLILYRTQSDLGTTLICLVGILTVMWLGEVPLRVILLVLVAMVVFAAFASLVGYRQDRFLFLNPWEDGKGGLGNGYQIIHSFYAFAEGGLLGVGLGNSREKFLYLPEAETDFIFAIIGEELGLIGALAVIILFLLLLYAGLRITRSAPDNFAAMLSGSFTLILVFQAFLNIGCVIGLLPTTGKPLPFISAGGSSLIASFLMLGIILSVSQASGAPSIYEQRRDDLRVVRVKDPLRGTSNNAKAERGRVSATRSSSAKRRSPVDDQKRNGHSRKRR